MGKKIKRVSGRIVESRLNKMNLFTKLKDVYINCYDSNIYNRINYLEKRSKKIGYKTI